MVKPLFSNTSSKMESIDTDKPDHKRQQSRSPPTHLISGEFEDILETKLEHKLDLSKIESLNKSIDKGDEFNSSGHFDTSANIKILPDTFK